MTSAEFRSWYDGFRGHLSESADPLAILAVLHSRIQRLDEVPTPYPVFVEDYWPFPEAGGTWARRWNRLWGPGWWPWFRWAEDDARRFRDAAEAFRALGRLDAERLGRGFTEA